MKAQLLEAVSAARAVSEKEENVLKEAEPAGSSTLREEWSTSMTKAIEAFFPVCRIKNIDIRNLVDEHGPDAAEQITWKADLVLEISFYYMREDRSADNWEYDIFTSKDITDIKKMLENPRKRKAHGAVFYLEL